MDTCGEDLFRGGACKGRSCGKDLFRGGACKGRSCGLLHACPPSRGLPACKITRPTLRATSRLPSVSRPPCLQNNTPNTAEPLLANQHARTIPAKGQDAKSIPAASHMALSNRTYNFRLQQNRIYNFRLQDSEANLHTPLFICKIQYKTAGQLNLYVKHNTKLRATYHRSSASLPSFLFQKPNENPTPEKFLGKNRKIIGKHVFLNVASCNFPVFLYGPNCEWGRQDEAKIGQDEANMGQDEGQDGPRWGQHGPR